jgi:hypothetical protein
MHGHKSKQEAVLSICLSRKEDVCDSFFDRRGCSAGTATAAHRNTEANVEKIRTTAEL